jgi:uncharacterized protein (TIGR02594 family)
LRLPSSGSIVQTDLSIFGLSRLGVYNRATTQSSYEITDHLGNVRAVIRKENNIPAIKSFADYYPFGELLPSRNSLNYRYAFQGQELDTETNMEAFQLRLWDGRIGRWLSPDPMGQYASPYLGMGNNPVSMIDPDGGQTDDFYEKLDANGKGTGQYEWFDGSDAIKGYEHLGVAFNNSDTGAWGESRFGSIVTGDAIGNVFHHNYNLEGVTIIGKSKGGNSSTPWMNTAISQFGVKELTGNNDGEKVKEYLATTGLGIGNPWCSAFVNWSMIQNGIKGTNSARALSWNGWGNTLSKPAYGSIATMTRKGGGHVGFVAGVNSQGKIVLLGGNQGDMVRYAAYNQSKMHFSYPKGFTPSYNLNTINVSTGATME